MFRIVVTILVFVIFALPRVAPAGDEVDYSAPYLVVEDGELVTKYPAKEHEGALAEADEETESSQQPDSIGAAAIAVAIMLLLLLNGRRKRRQ